MPAIFSKTFIFLRTGHQPYRKMLMGSHMATQPTIRRPWESQAPGPEWMREARRGHPSGR